MAANDNKESGMSEYLERLAERTRQWEIARAEWLKTQPPQH